MIFFYKVTDDEDNNKVIIILDMIDPFKIINTVLKQDDVAAVEFPYHVLDQLLFNEYNITFTYPYIFLYFPNYANIIHFASFAFWRSF